MKRATTLLSVPALLVGCLLQSACAEPPVVTGPAYDFDWRLIGAPDIEPYQVFDDGQKIYLQFAEPKHVPAVFTDTPGGLVLVHWHPDPPYIVVDQMENALVFRTADREARAIRAEPSGPPRIAHFGASRPSAESAVSPPRADGVHTDVNPGSGGK